MWSLAELEKCRAVLYPELHPDTVKERYTQFGGVMRIVLDQRSNYSLENVLQGVSRMSAYRLLSLDVEDDRSVELHYLAHAQVSNVPQCIGVFPPTFSCRVAGNNSLQGVQLPVIPVVRRLSAPHCSQLGMQGAGQWQCCLLAGSKHICLLYDADHLHVLNVCR